MMLKYSPVSFEYSLPDGINQHVIPIAIQLQNLAGTHSKPFQLLRYRQRIGFILAGWDHQYNAGPPR